MKTFAHIVLTRFNCRFGAGWTRRALDPAWLRHRFELFEEFCLPAIRSQTCRNFRWIAFFDCETPPEFIERIRGIVEPWWTPVFVDELTREAVLNAVRGAIPVDAGFVITTRLDNDDAVSTDFISRIQAGFRGEKEYLNVPCGFVMSNGRLYRHRDEHNAFVSLVEPADGPLESVWTVEHTEIFRHAPVRQLEGGPGWVQVVHGENVSNRIRGIRCSPCELGAVFTFDRGSLAAPPSVGGRFLERCVLAQFRSGRDWLAKSTRGVRRTVRQLWNGK